MIVFKSRICLKHKELMRLSDTIAAISTGGVKSAIGIIRLSGDDSIKISSDVFRPKSGKPFVNAKSRELILGELLGSDGSVIDSCLATLSRAPNSYTGENTVEFHCHGSPTVLSAGLTSLFNAGARQALAGEFTKRAFLNGRLDLTQAEAVIDLIDSETEAAAKNAALQLGGAVSQKAQRIYDVLTNISAHFHAILDYPDEELEPFEKEEFEDTLKFSENELLKLIKSFERGRILREGIKCAIIGRPNAGKSSLLNVLLGYERAIVTEIPGTTRDIIEEKVILGGLLLRISDTAGLRKSEDKVERIGIERALSAAREAELVLAVFDGSEALTGEDMETLMTANAAKRSIAVINKSDLIQKIDLSEIKKSFKCLCFVSALDQTGLNSLSSFVKEIFEGDNPETTGEIITSARQAEAISRAFTSISAAREALCTGVTPDAVLTEAENAMSALGELLGRTLRNDVTERIFSRFCVGK